MPKKIYDIIYIIVLIYKAKYFSICIMKACISYIELFTPWIFYCCCFLVMTYKNILNEKKMNTWISLYLQIKSSRVQFRVACNWICYNRVMSKERRIKWIYEMTFEEKGNSQNRQSYRTHGFAAGDLIM